MRNIWVIACSNKHIPISGLRDTSITENGTSSTLQITMSQSSAKNYLNLPGRSLSSMQKKRICRARMKSIQADTPFPERLSAVSAGVHSKGERSVLVAKGISCGLVQDI